MKLLLSVFAAAAIVAGGAVLPAHAIDQKPEKPRSAKSIECSKRADAKNLHGKERRKFRSECKHGKV
jgi:hypothetical protein